MTRWHLERRARTWARTAAAQCQAAAGGRRRVPGSGVTVASDLEASNLKQVTMTGPDPRHTGRTACGPHTADRAN